MDAQSRKELLGSRIRAYREAENITQERFASMVGTAQSYLSDIEAGHINVGFDLLCRIADGLDVSLGALGDLDPDRWLDKGDK
ncbi:helix-turn-helix domain-containing protein [Gordonibacter massiliensis (ex Traore et al. 2017)]|uniref:helix-turn-helix domain-containing protein n=1 Tax=Gordonibacter massiliensis (ex Traore et al. 2017) TaxID=1841863 RepID=UPI001C8B172B|nr:helix-turn-helix transcriptional regulator [Gordonibacter massiliensis (ex Traore et al. 2017)]MBX9032468.1 helix-turn-helix transcriptional regulator [Gordonibacter massiliensis (ex Traore et al. 2017)]